MQTCRKLGSLLLVFVFLASILTAVPVLGADSYQSITLEETKTGLVYGETGKAVVHGVAEDGSKTELTDGVTFEVTKTGSYDVIAVSNKGEITPKCEGTAVLTATYGNLKASVLIVVGTVATQKEFDTEAETSYKVTYPQQGDIKFEVDENDVPNVKGGSIKLADKDKSDKPYANRYMYTDTTEMDTSIKRSGAGSLHFKQIDLTQQTIVGTQTPLTTVEQSLFDGKWARTSGFLPIKQKELRVLEFWFYDNGTDSSEFWLMGTGAFPKVDKPNETTQSIRGKIKFGAGNTYSYAKDGGAQPDSQAGAAVPRSKGWHQFVLDYSSPDAYAMYVDGNLIYYYAQTGRNKDGLVGIEHDRTLKADGSSKHQLWLDSAVIYDVSITQPQAPSVSNVTINGKAITEQKLTASCTAMDVNGDLITGYEYAWEKSANGETGWEKVGTDSEYTLKAEDVGAYFRVGIIAKTDAAEKPNSEQVYSEAFGPIAVKPDLASQNFTKIDISHTTNVFEKSASKTDGPAKIQITGISENGTYDLDGYEKVTYSSDDPYTAAVSADGTITPNDVGYTIITATVENADGTKVESELFVTVSSAKSVQGFDGYTITNPDVNTHMELASDIVRSGEKAMRYRTPTQEIRNDKNGLMKWGLDHYGGYENANVEVAEGWFYDTAGDTDVPNTVPGKIYFQSQTIRPSGEAEYPYVLNLTVGVIDANSSYYKVTNTAAGRANRGPGRTNLTGTDEAGTGYLGDKVGTFTTDGQNDMPLIERSKGWHQVTLLVNRGDDPVGNVSTDKGTITLYIDGIEVYTEKYGMDAIGCVRGVGADASSANFSIYDDLIHAQLADNARPAIVTGLSLSGTAMEEKSMTVTAEVTDKNGDPTAPSTYQWEVSEDGETGWADVAGATQDTYTFATGDVGKYFRVKVTPHSTVEPVDGTPVYSDVIGPISELKTEPWVKADSYSISGEAKVGHTLTANYEYESDAETGDEEGKTIISWERSEEANGTYTAVGATGKTYNPTGADAGQYVRATITPVDVNGLEGPTVATAPVLVETTVEYFVATNGNDSNAGSMDAPFATITKARDVIREAVKAGLKGSIVVNIRGGEYPVSSTIAFTADDSGTEEYPITYRAYNGEKVTFSGGTVIPASKVSKLTESDKDIYGNKILDRIQDPVAKSKVVKIDLSDYAGEIPVLSAGGHSYAFETTWPKNQRQVEVYVNGSMVEPARWPNNEEDTAMFNPTAVDSKKTSSGGHDNTASVTITYPDPENETATWNQQAVKDDLMIGGYFGYHWYMSNHKVDSLDGTKKELTTLGGTAAAPTKNLAYFLYNIIEAIDAPGEGYIDRKNKIAYFYPDSELDENAEIRVAGFDSTLMTVTNAKYLNFEGLDFEYNRNTAVKMSGVDHINWDSCDVAHIGNADAMTVSGTNITVQNSNIFDTGMRGLTISGGNRKTLESANILVTNNAIHDQGHLPNKTYIPAIQVSNCVGATISHNEIFNNDHEAIAYASSNDIIIEYNDLHDVVQTSGDMGAIYCGRNVTEMGYVIRYNKIAHVGSKYSEGWSQSIFFDDGNSGAEIYGNIFYRGTLTMDKGANTSKSFAVKTNGGQFFHVYNNIFIDMPSALQFQSWNTSGFNSSKQVRYIAYNFDTELTKSGDTVTYKKGSNFDNAGASQWQKFVAVDFNSGIWADHYKGTIWEPIFSIFTQENRDKMVEYLPTDKTSGDPAKAAALAEEIAPARQNFFRDNAAIQIANPHITVQSNNETIGDNYTNENITTADGKPLFVDYDNENFQLTNEGLAEIRKTVANFPNIDTSKIGLQAPVDGSRPVASNVKLGGDNVAGGKARVTYTYTDADNQKEVGTTYQWYVAESADGDYELIRGEFATELTIPASLSGKYLKCVVTPRDSRMLPGQAVETAPVQIVADTSDVDKTQLRQALTEANELLSEAVVGNEDGQYPQSAVDALQALVDEAQALVNSTTSYQYQIDNMAEKLNTGIGTFKNSVVTSEEFMSLERILKDAENWEKYVGNGEFVIEDGVLTLPEGTGAAYTGEQYKNKIFVFKLKIEAAEEDATPTTLNTSISFRAQKPAVLWASENMGYLWWIKPEKNESQFFQPNKLQEFTKGLLELGKEYTIGVGVYDTAGEAVKWKLFIDDFEAPVYEYTYTKEETGGDNLYGQAGYFMAASGSEVITTISPVTTADKSALNNMIAQAEAIRAAAVSGDAYDQYPSNVVAVFESTIARAKEVNGDPDVVQHVVDAEVSVLEDAIKAFKLGASTKMVVSENGEATINYELSEAEFNVDTSAVSSFVLHMDPSQKQPEYKFTVKAPAGDVKMNIAKDALLSASGWDGTFNLPIAGTTPSGTISGDNLMVVTMGVPGKVVSSTELARIVLPGQANKMLSYMTENGSYKAISKNSNLSADTMEAAKAALPNGGVAKLSVGNDMVIYTSYLTEFVAYDWKAPTTEPTPTTTPDIPNNIPSGPSGIPSGPSGSIGNPSPSPSPDRVQYKFTDIVGHWAGLDINEMAEKGIVSGVTKTTFEPDREITRAEFAALITRALKLSAANDDAVFKDVAADSWYAGEVAAAAGAGLISGYEGYFRPEENITREEMAVVIVKAYLYRGKAPLTGKLDRFTDKDSISDWAKDYVDQAVSVGLISGMTTDTFVPQENATRAQVASLIKRLLDQ